jgi:hypothetical protein
VANKPSEVALPERGVGSWISILPLRSKKQLCFTEVPISACIVVAIGACTEGHEEPRAIEAVVVPVDDNQ